MSQSLSHSLQALKVILLRNTGKLSSLFFFLSSSLHVLSLSFLSPNSPLGSALCYFLNVHVSPNNNFTWHVLKNLKDSLHFLTCEPNHRVCFFFSPSFWFRKAASYYFSGFIYTQNAFSLGKNTLLFICEYSVVFLFFPRMPWTNRDKTRVKRNSAPITQT